MGGLSSCNRQRLYCAGFRQENVVLVAHQAILRAILAYFLEKPLSELPYIKVPLHTLIKITPVASGCQVRDKH